MNTIARLAACLALLVAFVAPARALQGTLPNRPPDFVANSGWVDSALHDDWGVPYENCDAAPVLVPVAPANTIAVKLRFACDYAYAGEVFVGASAPPTGFIGGSWNLAALGYQPNSMPNSIYNLTDFACPNPMALVQTATVGDNNNFSLAVWPAGQTPPTPSTPAGFAAFRREILEVDPVTSPVSWGLPVQTITNQWDVAEWKVINGQRGGRNFHRFYLSAVSDPSVIWGSLTGVQGTYTHAISYAMSMEVRARIAIWYVTPQDLAANPALLGL